MKFSYLILLFAFIGCGNKSLEIKGRGYFVNSKMKHFSERVEYNEVLISDSTFVYFSEILRLNEPKKYKIEKNRIVFFDRHQKIEEYSPVCDVIDYNTIVLSYKTQIDTLKRINNEVFFIDSLLKGGEEDVFLNYFYRRKLKFTNFKKYVKHRNDTVFYHKKEEKEIILPYVKRKERE